MSVALLLLFHACLLAGLAVSHSPTYDETAHLPAGISHWQLGRFELYRVNPPLVRMLAAMPVLALQPTTDWSSFSARSGARPEFEVGKDFIAANGDASFRYYILARWVGVLFSLIGGYVCFLWARDLWGTCPGLLTLTLWCFEPNILGNAQTIQADVPAATMAVTIAYCFWRWSQSPTVRRSVTTGIALGIGLLTKTSLVFMAPVIAFLWMAGLFADTWKPHISYRRAVLDLLLIAGIGVYILNLGYAFDGSFKSLGSYDFVSSTLRYPSTAETPMPSLSVGNRFSGTLLGALPIPLPKDFVSGIDEQKKDFEGRLRSYLRGETRQTGWWYFYLYAMVVKIPIGVWLLLAQGLFVLCRYGPGRFGWQAIAAIALPAAVFLIAISSVTGMTHHMRYSLPTFPFLLIAAGNAGRVFTSSDGRWGRYLAATATLFAVASSLSVYPHSHSYFNEISGGPRNGHFHLLSSNIDYGEDLFFFKDWLDRYGNGRPVTLAYFGNFDPRIAGIEFSLPPKVPQPGLHAISVNYLHSSSVPLHDGQGGMSYGDDYSQYLKYDPVGTAGYGIFIYDLDATQLARTQVSSDN